LPPDPAEGSLEDFMPKLDGILETAIHTEDMVRARAFYEDVLGLEPIYSDNRLSAYAVAGRDVLLVFRKGTTRQTAVLPSGTIPGHGGDGVLHVAFAIGKDELDRWEKHLADRGVAIEGRNEGLERSARNIDRTTLTTVAQLNAWEILKNRTLLITKSGFQALLADKKKTETAKA